MLRRFWTTPSKRARKHTRRGRNRLGNLGAFTPALEVLEQRRLLTTDVNIIGGGFGAGTLDAVFIANGFRIGSTDPDIGINTLSAGALQTAPSTATLVVAPARSILFTDQGGAGLTLQSGVRFDTLFGGIGGQSIQFANTRDSLSTAGGAIAFATGAGAALTLGNLNSNGGRVILTSDNPSLGGSVNAGAALVSINPSTSGTPISLGTKIAGELGLTQTELANVTASSLLIVTSGPLTVNAPIANGANWNTLELRGGGGISQGPGAALQVPNLALQSLNGINLNENNAVTNLAFTNTASSGVGFTDVNPLTLTAVNGLRAGSNSTGTIIQAPLLVNNLALTGLAVRLTADSMSLENGTINVGTQGPLNVVVLSPLTSGRAVNLETTTSDPNVGLRLVQADLNTITASVVRIGSSQTGPLTVFSTIANGANWNTLDLISGANIIESGPLLQPIPALQVTNLALQAGGGIYLTGNNAVTNLAFSNTRANTGGLFDVIFNDSNPLTLAAVDGVAGCSNSGATQIDAPQLANTVAMTGTRVELFADLMLLQNGMINVGTGPANAVSLRTISQGRAINLQNTIADPDAGLHISQADLNTITANAVRIGDAQAGNLTLVSNITIGTNFNTLSLLSGGAISENSGVALQVPVLVLQAASGISLPEANAISSLSYSNSTSGQVTFYDNNNLAIRSGADVGDTFLAVTGADAGFFNLGPITARSIEVVADRIVLNGINAGTINVGRGTNNFVWMLPPNAHAGRPVNLENSPDRPNGELRISQTDLDTITAGVVQIGGPQSGPVSVVSTIANGPNWNTLHLVSGGGIAQNQGAVLQVTNLALEAAGAVNLSGNNTVANLAGNATNAGAGFSFIDSAPRLTVGTVDSVAGITTNGGSLTLSNTNAVVVQSTLASTAVPSVNGASSLAINYTAGAALPNGLVFSGGAGSLLTVSDQGGTAAHSYIVAGNRVTRDGGAPMQVGSNVTAVTVLGGDNASGDTFNVTPSPTVTFKIEGGLPIPPTNPGDALTVPSGGTLTNTLNASGNSGNWSFPGMRPVAYSGIETLIPSTSSTSTPTARPDTFVLSLSPSSSGSGTTSVLANDTSPDNQPASLRATRVSTTTRGSLTLDTTNGSFSYTPGATFQGIDRFTYQVSEGATVGNTVTVTLLSHTAVLVDKLYNQVLGRSAEDQGLQYWTSLVDGTNGQRPQPLSVVAAGIFESAERLNAYVAGGRLGNITPPQLGYYPQFLLRQAEPDGLAYWEGIWRRDGGPDNVISGMISSPEFYASAVQTHPLLTPNAAWVTSLYDRLLKRLPEAQGLQYWTSNLDNGTLTRLQVVLGFVRSDENFRNLTSAFSQQYLNRQPTSGELTTYVDQFRAGGSQRDVQLAIINTTEYRDTPPTPAPGTVAISPYAL